MKKVLIVDDSALMRKHISSILKEAGFQITTARNGAECLDKISTFRPDVITLDINMPIMDGLTCLSKIMTQFPTPVVMVSSLTEKGAIATFEALALGAVDYFPKPGGTVSLNMLESTELLIQKVSSAARSRVTEGLSLKNKLRLRRETSELHLTSLPVKKLKLPAKTAKIVIIGVSTGGPNCLQIILEALSADFPLPIVVAQHMPASFTRVFAERLNKYCKLEVQEVSTLTELKAGNVYIAKGDADAKLLKRGDKLLMTSTPPNNEYLWHPSVNKLVYSALSILSAKSLLCIQLTGMGNDGVESMYKAHTEGAFTIAEDKSTAIVYGMPKELIDKGGASVVLANDEIADAIQSAVS